MSSNSYPLVSIGIPTYHRADGFLKQALESAVNQTYPNVEIIVSDNCSPDHTESVVKSFGDERVRYFKHRQNIGANNNFNYCVEQARGSYFLLLHDDDMIDEDFVEICMERSNYDTQLGLIRTGTRVIDDDGHVKREIPNKVAGLSTEEFFTGWFERETALFLCSTLFNTNRLREVGGFHSKHNLFQDVMAEFQVAAKFGRLDIYDVKASFRKHSAEMTFAAKVGDWCEDSLQLLELMCTLAPESSARIRREGLAYFSRRNYARAKAIKSPFKRLAAFHIVCKHFNYQYFPPVEFILPTKSLLRRMQYVTQRQQVSEG